MVVMGIPMNIDYGARDEGYAQAREDLQKKLKRGVCHKFQQGQCTRGDECKFAHVMQAQDAEELVQPAERPVNGVAAPGASLGAEVQAFAHTQATSDAPICVNSQKGKCKRGEECKFQHLHANEEQVAQKESEQVQLEVQEEPPAEEKTRAEDGAPVCQNYQKGKCKRGAACRFRHALVPAEEPQEEEWKAPVRVVRRTS
ncbi:hypothetical protein KRP22_007867 [Phytophthora ramorum]|nr:Zinc finger CCCH domain-containing protein 42 [Phytophthora ramorum]